jgi:tetratricopeptide (TPR) repeat protein
MHKTIDELIVELSKSPFDPALSFSIAEAYISIGQTAAAVTFYLRTAEYGYETHPDYVYAALIKSSKCFENQTGRQVTVLNLLLKAVAYIPERPEGWMLLSRCYQADKKWQESYTASEVGIKLANKKCKKLPADVGYPGFYSLEFQKGVAAWWVGRQDETGSIFRKLIKEPIDPIYMNAIIGNMDRLNIPKE